jgi:RNA polymerase sigma factor for flagellar operon FliA
VTTLPYALEQLESAEARRERLILEQLPQVHLIARRLHERVPDNVCLDDLVSAGILGLIAAIDNFQESFGVKLNTYAEYKIRGAILDSLRGLDWASRHRRKKAKDIEACISTLEQRLRRPPTQEEVAAEMGLSLEKYQERLADVHGIQLDSLEAAVGVNGSQTLLSTIPDTAESLPSEALERSELERILRESIEAMPKTERTILGLYYNEELTLREIAEVMNMHISRVAEMKSHSILRLRAHMRRKWPVKSRASR